MALFENAYMKRGLVMACAGALALVFGAVAAPDEAAAQCSVVSSGPTDPGPVPTFGELRDDALGPADGDFVSVDCDDSIDSDSIVDGSITSADLGTGSVGSDEVIDDSLTSDDLAANSVTASELADDSVDTAAIQDGAVTTEKLADDSVTWGKLAPGVRNRIDENSEGVAVALALQNPDLVGNESFGLSVNWGGFSGSNAIGIAATGVLGRGIFGPGDRLAVAGGVGVGLEDDAVGGRVGAQLSW